MNENEKQESLRQVFHAAMLKGLCRTQKEFAALIPVDPSALSSAMNGNPRFLTESLLSKVKLFALREGLDSTQKQKTETIEVPAGFRETLENLSSVLASQARLLESQARMLELYQRTGNIPLQKNGLRDEL